MESDFLAVALAAVAAAGCVQAPLLGALPPEPGLPPPQTFTDAHDGCTGYLLGLLIDPMRTDSVLPPGFHLRDAREFLHGVGTGQALLLVLVTLCAPTAERPAWRDATAALFVQPPTVAGERPPADHDVYEVEHYSPEPDVRARLGAWGWPVANLTLEREEVAELDGQPFGVAAGRQPARIGPVQTWGDALFRFGGATAPQDVAGSAPVTLRIWRDTPVGLARLDYATHLPLGSGLGYCVFHPDSTLSRLTGTTACGAPTQDQQGPEPQPHLVATFDADFRATGVLQPGVRAQ